MTSEIISLLGVFIGLIVMIIMAWKGVPIMFVGIFVALVTGLFSGMNVMDLMANSYMAGFAGFAQRYWLIFMFSAIFGKLLSESGAARVLALKCAGIARKFPGKEKLVAVWSMTLLAGILCYGGISLFVLVFTLVSISRDLYQELDIPWHLYMFQGLTSGAIILCMSPGSPQIHNIIPTTYLGTTPMAAPILSIIMMISAFIMGHFYLVWTLKKSEMKNEGFYPSGSLIAKAELGYGNANEIPNHNVFLCLLPSIILLITMNGFGFSAVTSLILANIATFIIFFKDLMPANKLKKVIGEACASAFTAVGGTCAVVGFGAVVAAVPAFNLVLNSLDQIPGPPIVQLILAVNAAAGITGSGSGGLTIAMDSLSQRFLASGIPPEVIHRMASVSCCGLDSLPHNGANLNRIFVCRLSFKEAYGHIFVTNLVIPVICAIIGAVVYSFGIW